VQDREGKKKKETTGYYGKLGVGEKPKREQINLT